MKQQFIRFSWRGIFCILLMFSLIDCGSKPEKVESVDELKVESVEGLVETPVEGLVEAPISDQIMTLKRLGQMRMETMTPVASQRRRVASQIGAAPLTSTTRLQTEPAPTEFNTESYDRIAENPFLEVTKNPLSTFSIDVDVASYANVRRFINNSQLPPPDAVRIEELINYFTYNYPPPQGVHPFSITTEISDCPWKNEHRLLLIGLQGKKLQLEALPPNNLVFLLDVSGSMDEPNKLPLLKASMRLLVNQLRPQDRVAIVVYAGAAGLVLPSTTGDQKPGILAALEQLQAGGSTAGGAGIELAYEVAKEHFLKNGNNRVILATDGDFNVGPSSDAEMQRLIEQKRRLGIYLTVLGFGMGNYKDSKMEKLADTGNGNYAYIDDILEAKKVLVNELGGTLLTLAKDVKIQIEFNPAKIKAYRLIGYENRMLRAEDFHDDRKDAGELGAGHSVTALYELIPADSKTTLPQVDALKYQTTTVNPAAAKSPEMLTVKFRYKAPADTVSQLIELSVPEQDVKIAATSTNFRFAAAVASFGMLLRQSEYRGDATFEKVLELAKAALGSDVEGYRHEFLRLVEKSKLLRAEK